MGRVTTPPYRLEIFCPTFRFTPSVWRVKAQYGIPGDGKPTTANIDRWVTSYEESLKPGGPNAHLGLHQVSYARIIRQSDNQIVAEWNRSKQRPNEPLFKVV